MSFIKRLFSKISLQKLTEMLNEYNQKVSLDTNSELPKAKAELSEVQRKVSSIIKMVTEAGISIFIRYSFCTPLNL